MRLFAEEVYERVPPAADLIHPRRYRPEFALRPDLAEIGRESPEELLGHEVDGPDVGVEEAGYVSLEEVRIGDEHAAQPELHVQCRRELLVEGGIGFDYPHPAADLRKVVGVDDRLPLLRRLSDLGILEFPVQDVLYDVIGRLRVPGPSYGGADSLVALEPADQEPVLALAEESGQPAQDPVHVRMSVRLQQVLQHREEPGEDLLLPVAERVVLQEIEADEEPVLRVLHAEHPLDDPVHDVREVREVSSRQILF